MPRYILALVLAAVLAAQAAAGPPVPGERRPVWTDAHVVRQSHTWSCGAAALAALLSVEFGDQMSEQDVLAGLARHTPLDEAMAHNGFSFLALKRFVEARGYQATGYARLQLADLQRLTPLVTPIETNGGLHYVILLDIDDTDVLIADPAAGLRRVPRPRFEEMWPLRAGMAVVIAVRNQ